MIEQEWDNWISSAEVKIFGWKDGDYLFVRDIEERMKLKKYKIIKTECYEQGYWCKEVTETV